MEDKPENKEITDFYEYIQKGLKWLIEVWKAGEGDLLVEVRDEKGKKQAKMTGSIVDRVGKKKEGE